MKINKLKVRPKKEVRTAACAAEFATMLACWASYNDLSSQGQCAESARALQACMRTKAKKQAVSKPTINYHLARFSKQV
ncbi:hypothetical protein K437DRAFT_228308 [Tilletiaria anomala UBC 951]|uniref:COX assembly mitochondrial protein n=1 Tax=Tilletiaria anomala (strain ATCC 24038 / CBS 436.72 / UBC 951) TaxID=1037660 RepID=A0A066VJN9_TILAU|nr:uncharacterized protein K437DRAFT_228308 [Tilletiaria anomala UBC 951]KDN38949.1 hypothetical protein K437DRAFT_228308 [Tilletiaria anomala UBC 951]